MSNSRGRFFIDRKVQGALAKRIILHWGIFFLLSFLCIFALEYFMGEPGLTIGQRMGVIWNEYAFFFVLMLAMVPSFIYDTMKLSNRFVGPIVRLRNSIRSLADGDDVKELKFRGNDFWLELSTDFNRVAERVNKTK